MRFTAAGSMSPPASPIPPLFVFVTLVAVDGFVLYVRSRAEKAAWWTRWIPLAMRPLAALALCNALYRLHPATFKFNVLSFPLWANAWADSLPSAAGQLSRTLLALVGIAAALAVLHHALNKARAPGRWLPVLWGILLTAQLTILLAPRGWEGATLPWRKPGKVYAWDARRVDALGGSLGFLARYDEVQPRQTVHARSHPPGATLLAHWLLDTRQPDARMNVVRSLLLQSLNVPVLYLLGRSFFNARAGLAAAALGAAAPAAAAYGGYSQDTAYAVLFNLYLLLSWAIARSRGAPWLSLSAGVVLFALSMLTFSWSIVAAAGFAFVAISRFRRAAPPGRALTDLVLPPAMLLLLHLVVAFGTGFDYLTSYRQAYAFHVGFYPFAGPSDWVKALIGGQLDLLWGMGPLVAGVFLAALPGAAREPGRPLHLLLWSVLGCYGIAILFGPNPLKLETARCWYWVTTVAVLVAAGRLMASDGGTRPVVLAAGASLATSLISLAYFNFGI